MRTAVIKQFGSPLVIEDRPVPEPGRGQIRVKIETSTLRSPVHSPWRST